ncbi:DsbA family protein [Arenimonas sp.]|uniref:DsbA family protein n=1 Tax=Arenimonas sp. TaxID=1872635 RepID=UPI0039E5CC33
MLRRLLIVLALLIPLAACKPSTPEDTATPAPADSTASTPAPTETPADASAPAEGTTPAPAPAPVPAPGSPEAPRLGTDYEVLETPQPTIGQGKIEVAEVFSYMCIHCAHFQPSVDAWKQRMPADVRWEYVPGAFGGAWDEFARAYYAAEILGVQARTHNDVFKAIHVDHVIKTGSPDEIADLYAKWGVDRTKFLETMKSFGVTAKLNRGKQFAQRTGVGSTPTMVINGKYRANVTPDRGFEGLLATVDFLVAQERAAAATPAAAPTP